MENGKGTAAATDTIGFLVQVNGVMPAGQLARLKQVVKTWTEGLEADAGVTVGMVRVASQSDELLFQKVVPQPQPELDPMPPDRSDRVN